MLFLNPLTAVIRHGLTLNSVPFRQRKIELPNSNFGLAFMWLKEEVKNGMQSYAEFISMGIAGNVTL